MDRPQPPSPAPPQKQQQQNKLVKPYKRLQSSTRCQAHGHVKNGLPIASLMLIACLVPETMQR